MSKDISKRRHIAKAITWRVIASTTTFLLAMFFFGDDPNAKEKATAVAVSEAVLKMVLYYLHERNSLCVQRLPYLYRHQE
jgi:uncharacterized membrane protein